MANIFKMFRRNAAKVATKVANENKAEMLCGKTFSCRKTNEKKEKIEKSFLTNSAALVAAVAALNFSTQNATVVKTAAEEEKTTVEIPASVVENKVDEEVDEIVECFFDEDEDDFEEIVFETEDDDEPVNFNEIAEMLGEIEEADVPANETVEGFVTFDQIEAELEEEVKIFDENGNAIGEDCGCLEPSDFEKSISAMLEGKEDDLDWFSEYEIAEMLGMVDNESEEYGDFVLQFGEDEIGVSELLILNLAFKQGVMPCDIRKEFGTNDRAIYDVWCSAWKPHLKYDFLKSYFDYKIATNFAVAKEVA